MTMIRRQQLYPIVVVGVLFHHCSTGLTMDIPEDIVLSKRKECLQDFDLLKIRCNVGPQGFESNIMAMRCIHDIEDVHEILSASCQTLLWNFKKAVTTGKKLNTALNESCGNAIPEECAQFSPESGELLSCVTSKKMEILDQPDCVNFLNYIEIMIFSDFHFIGDFVDKCSEKVIEHNCGRISTAARFETQFQVLSCLGEHVETLDDACKHEILRIAELQANDYHLDRGLYFSCRMDREHFCGEIPAGDGQVYECLMRNMGSTQMSPGCRAQIIRRQRLVAQDYKVSRGLVKNCKEEIRSGSCRKGASDDKPIRMVQILVCLEEMLLQDEGSVKPVCINEMQLYRGKLMEDYHMSPELVLQCSADISASCGSLKHGDETIHCLMKLASDRKISSAECQNQIQILMEEVNVSEDWSLDPVLKRTCSDVVSAVCNNLPASETMNCLMSQLSIPSRHITQECKQSLLEIQYFIVRSFKLDPKLFNECKADAEKLCNAPHEWHRRSQNDHGSALVFPCLVRHLYSEDDENYNDKSSELSDDCADQVERVLGERAISVRLHPEIDDACRSVIIMRCTSAVRPGEEMACLQDMMDELEGECKTAIMQYTRMEAKNAVFNSALASACHTIIDEACTQEVSRKDEGAVIKCLINYKENANDVAIMGEKCLAQLNHWQILSMKDWHFSYKFTLACKTDVKKFCVKISSPTKYNIVNCLSTIMTKDIVEERRPSLTFACSNELKFELLQQHTDVELNHDISKDCQREISKFCDGSQNVLECLKKVPHKSMTRNCMQKLFKEEQEEVLINTLDHTLMLHCKHEIKQRCPEDSEANGILQCLQKAKSDPDFDPLCRTIVIQRTIEQMKDYRLNPRLLKSCRADLPKFCYHILRDEESGKDSEKQFLEGKVIECLKSVYRRVDIEDEKLTATCHHEVGNILRMSVMNFNANPSLLEKCPKSLQFCRNETHYDPKTLVDNGQVEECMMGLFKERKISDVGDGIDCKIAIAKIIEDSNLDIHVDPLLTQACALDLTKFCADVPRGHGLLIKCLVSISKHDGFSLEPSCNSMLQKRLDMFNMALQVVPIEGLSDLLKQIGSSPQKHYFFISFLSFVGVCFLIGLCAGRIFKSSLNENKNK